MAYDEHGNWYFNPNEDADDAEMVTDEARREIARNFVKNQNKLANQHQETNNMWQEALQSEGIDPQTYEQLYAEDPEHAKQLMQAGMQHLAKGIKRGRDAKGRFTKPGGPLPVGQRSHFETDRMTEIRTKAKTKTLSEQDELDVIDALFPTGL